jgi:hypothetical protein
VVLIILATANSVRRKTVQMEVVSEPKRRGQAPLDLE